ncbi:MAG TPA: hypothetical protein VFN29_11470 [Chiayiivirga sp.]|nr:hypothetical protein [Chiayiivirga sp.]
MLRGVPPFCPCNGRHTIHVTVPRTLDAGACVIRKAAVQEYGRTALARLAAPALRVGKQAGVDREFLRPLESTKTLTPLEQGTVGVIKKRWISSMAQALMYGKDLSRELIDYMESLEGRFFARGGIAPSDTVPALLTPGEYVINRATVQRLGVGFFDAINRMAAPAKARAGRALAGVQGFATGGFVAPVGVPMMRPVLTADAAPTRTVRVELAAGGQSVTATLDARDEARLLSLLNTARARAL